MTGSEVVLPAPCLVVLVGAAGSGKSTWAAAHFAPGQVVSSDALRALVGHGVDDLAATDDAFDLLERVVAQRLGRRLTTVVDTLGLDPERRARWLALARRNRLATACVVFEMTAAEGQRRNRGRDQPVPQRIVTGQVRALAEERPRIEAEGWDVLLAPAAVRTAPASVAASTAARERQAVDPVTLGFGLQVPSFDWPGGSTEQRDRLVAVARAAEDAGFESLWLMDHLRQIPMFGPAWDPMPDPWTTLAFVAAATDRLRLGTLVSGVCLRPVPMLGKAVATLDVLSGGRAICGLGAGWFDAEAVALGLPFPPLAERYALLEDALELLPLLWGKGAPPYDGRRLHVPEALCYPRPLQDPLPVLVGGKGERRTLALVARHAQACNIIGEVEVVERKVAVLAAHCRDAGRDPDDVAVTQLSTTLTAATGDEVRSLVGRLRPRSWSEDRYATYVHAATVADQVGRFRALADAGVGTAIVSLPDLDGTADAIERFAPVIAAFSSG